MFNNSKQYNLLKIILVLLITNIITFFVVDDLSRHNENRAITKMFKREISNYIVLIDRNESEKAQTMMIGFIYPEILDSGKEKSTQDKEFLCDSWNKGLGKIIYRKFNLGEEPLKRVDKKKEKLNILFEKGTIKLNKLCKND